MSCIYFNKVALTLKFNYIATVTVTVRAENKNSHKWEGPAVTIELLPAEYEK